MNMKNVLLYKTINEKKCTGVWEVNNNKVSHVDSKVIDNILVIIIKTLEK